MGLRSNTGGVWGMDSNGNPTWQSSDYVAPKNYVQPLNIQQEINVEGGPTKAVKPKRSAKVNIIGDKSSSTDAPISYYGTSAPSQAQSADPGRVATPESLALDNLRKQQASQYSDYQNAQKAIAAGNFLVDVANANNAYESIAGQAQVNIMLARNQASDAIYRGRQAQLDRQSEGNQAGQDALLAMAAQGQSVQGAGVQKIQGSFEAMGIFNGMQEEINSMREALGFKLEELNYEYQIEQAGIDRDMAIISSGLNSAVKIAGA